ncbi:Uncharacterised protein [Mycobacteroides abscessus subsp. massiliense]|nr:Uncharacterised protein [Mycobacteroides abscessus subsp. massiliense]SKJ94915.1 Uncharacterised protein [Mycobacteroides abscessus subsp. massiliense]SKM87446.1 Uncharacterised protein [Mycobacteroides abscessus subsp. massiliense]SKP61222.1 Uncharacterised protein [Mycobacteroides abscessus subsp. massiliense]SKQ31801.1 Uncharacterised protein [Mycobacteroides abscessus subsp. massiliense]
MNGMIAEWLFRGQNIETALNELEASGFAVRAASDPLAIQRVMPLEDFSETIRTAALESLEAHLAFFCFENSARELIAQRLSETHGTAWWDECTNSTLQKKVKERQEKEGKNRWHMKRGAGEIYYTDFGDLASLIRNNWDDFDDLFPHPEWVISRFSELELSRNIVAHNNSLEKNEMDRIKLYLRDWIRQVG